MDYSLTVRLFPSLLILGLHAADIDMTPSLVNMIYCVTNAQHVNIIDYYNSEVWFYVHVLCGLCHRGDILNLNLIVGDLNKSGKRASYSWYCSYPVISCDACMLTKLTSAMCPIWYCWLKYRTYVYMDLHHVCSFGITRFRKPFFTPAHNTLRCINVTII